MGIPTIQYEIPATAPAKIVLPGFNDELSLKTSTRFYILDNELIKTNILLIFPQ